MIVTVRPSVVSSTGDVLRANHSQVIEFRASIVIGSGSLSFQMIRALVERLPITICPKWVQVKAQPIAIEDLLAYLSAAVKLPVSASQINEIGGPDQVSYGQLMQEYARQRGLTRWMIPVPLLTPYLSSLWLGLVTPIYARVGRKLVESLRNPTLISNNTGFIRLCGGMTLKSGTCWSRLESCFAARQTRGGDSMSTEGLYRTLGWDWMAMWCSTRGVNHWQCDVTARDTQIQKSDHPRRQPGRGSDRSKEGHGGWPSTVPRGSI